MTSCEPKILEQQNQDKTLSKEEVERRLKSYKEPGITDELYGFGEKMVDEIVDRFKSLDSKATGLAAYSVGLITLLASTQATWTKALSSWAAFAIILSGAIALIAAAVAIASLWLKQFACSSQDDWMKASCLDDVDWLRRFHVIVLWSVHTSYQAQCRKKATLIGTAQGLLLASALLLVFSIANALVPTLFPV